MKKQLIISTSIDLVRIAPERIVYIASDGNYSTLIQSDGEMRMLSFQLGQIEKMISSQLGSDGNIFIRIGKSLIINRSYIYYINISKQKLTLSDVSSFSHTVTASKEALKQLKELLEKLHRQFPKALIVGHHDLNPTKSCPCFDVHKEGYP
jgi:DNA-binding LytR/AlgR family response regulator